MCVCVCSDRFELLRAERENAMFPDEVDTPQDTPARIRFQKYERCLVPIGLSLYKPNIPLL